MDILSVWRFKIFSVLSIIMYIIAPLTIIIVSAIMMAIIIWRKFPYLKKLPVDSAPLPERGLLAGFFPEVHTYLRKIDVSLYRNLFFKELEKFLRRLRVISLKIDTFTHRLIDKIKTNHLKKETIEHLTPKSDQNGEVAVPVLLKNLSVEEKQKKEEHDLIIEIAKNPKNAELYKKLANIYILTENFSDAIEALETVLKLDPEDKIAAAKFRAVKKHLPE